MALVLIETPSLCLEYTSLIYSFIPFISLYSKGVIPFAALVANSISQDGDALFPLIAMDKKSALWATILTTIPAIVIGFIVYIVMH